MLNPLLVNIRQNTNNTFNSLNVPLPVLAGAFPGDYVLHITVGGSSSNCTTVPLVPSLSEDIPLKILGPQPGGTPDKFVFVQGYALFQVTRYDPPLSGNPNTGPLAPCISRIQALKPGCGRA
jgi:hypothetical protein